ncbi:RNA polymerase sigma factor [Flavobacterium difficile]|uniref:RNA polymerase sigma factor n=1 Tax=Flavobacterium difficile TaxID=2709659 RepID=UPI001A9C6A37|nr:sigma-70 family RNA polymerase sigma factor [Flavobacterium difficile]
MKVKTQYHQDELVVLIKNRDQKAFSYLYDNYSKALFGIVFGIIKNYEETEDLIQNTFIKIWNNFENYDCDKARLYTWMINIARNVAIDHLRSKKNKNQNQNISNNGKEINRIFTEDLSSETIGLKEVVDKLKNEDLQLIDLAYYRGFTQLEISEKLAIPLGTVKTKMRKALLVLRDQLKEKTEEK